MDEKLFVAFAKFEENQREHDRVRVIYKYALDKIRKEKAQELFKNYTIHEKKYGDRAGGKKRKYQYEEEIKVNPMNYDASFDFIRLIENDGDVETLARAVPIPSNVRTLVLRQLCFRASLPCTYICTKIG
ncbi:CRNKL1 (predicted) [Pycnogonum litorale]